MLKLHPRRKFMRVRTALLLVGIAGLLAVPVATAERSGHTNRLATAEGHVHWTIPLPNAFGVEIKNRLSFEARQRAGGGATGHFSYVQIADGQTYKFKVSVTCMGIYDGNRAKIGGVVTSSTDVTEPPGTFAWFQVFDNGEQGEGPPDQSSLVGFGDEAANEAFCNSNRLPRFGPWDVKGELEVRP
jgi:hypothetical protein